MRRANNERRHRGEIIIKTIGLCKPLFDLTNEVCERNFIKEPLAIFGRIFDSKLDGAEEKKSELQVISGGWIKA